MPVRVKSVWLDTNVIIYFLRTNQIFSGKARNVVKLAGNGKITLLISPIVIAECVYVLTGKQFKATKSETKTALISFINLPGIDTEEKSVIEEALTNFSDNNIDFADAYIAAHAKSVSPSNVMTENISDFQGLDVIAEVIPEPTSTQSKQKTVK
jgi:Predicted nucleic acid-binding protein, contains PIN domain